MRLSWKIGRFAGIDLYVHATFLLVFLFVPDVRLVLSVFGCVVLHEFGHALMARRFGIETEDITLYPIGGVARLRRLPRAPGAELLIAIAGPAVNFAIAAALLGVDWLGLIKLVLMPAPGNFVTSLLFINLGLGIFNLIPAFPMDGGRVLRALLSGFLGRARATTIAAGVGRVLALLFVVAVVWSSLDGHYPLNPFHLVLAAFIYFAGRMEEAQVLLEERRRESASGGQGIWMAPPGYRWVDRGDGIWQLAPMGVRIPDPGPYNPS